MREEFEEELKKRLSNYLEEPEEELWKKIAPHIVTVVSKPVWIRWVEYGSYIFMGIILATLYPSATDHTVIQKVVIPKSPDEIAFNDTATEKNAVDVSDNADFEKAPIRKRMIVLEAGILDDPFSEDKTDYSAINLEVIRPIESLKQEYAVIPSTNLITDGEPYSNKISVVATPATEPVSNKPAKPVQKKKASEEEKAIATEKRDSTRKDSERMHQKFNFYFIAMPTFGYQRVESNQSDNILIESIKKVPAFSTSRLGIRVELGVETFVSKKLKVFGGILYYQRKQTIDYSVLQIDSTVFTSGPNGEIIVDPRLESVNKSFEYELKNLGAQVGINYQLTKRVFLQTIGTGIEFQIALNKLDDANKLEGFTSNPSVYMFYNLYYRLQYPAEGRLKAVFQPTLNYSLYLNKDLHAPFYVKPYGLGLNIGCTYNF
jgi:hypothetical protein